MVSAKQNYILRFFSPPNTTNRYVGISFSLSEETVIWVANRDTPLKDSSGAATLSKGGNLVVLDGTNRTVWSTNLTTTSPVINSIVQILDTGNLVLREEDSGDTLWESFSHPTDAMVQGMRISQNVNTGKQVLLTAWKNETDPGMGSFTGGIDAMSGTVQLFSWNDGRPHWRSGPWNGQIFLGIKDVFYAYLDAIAQVNSDGAGNIFFSPPPIDGIVIWNSSRSVIRKLQCSPICRCLRGFEPVNEEEWGRGNWTSGCRRRNQLRCGDDGFERVQYMKVPDFAKPSSSSVQDECAALCRGNCSCIAYAYDSYIGCMFWSDTLIDTQEFDGVGVDLYVRLSASEFVKRKGSKAQDSSILEAGQMFTMDSTAIVLKDETKEVNIGDLPKFTFKMLANATNQFHEDNLLGRAVYMLLDWNMRYNIIEGISRGILYLHRDSRLRVIHRDLKPSNVLLDQDWNPKISDFGIARIFRDNEDQCNTARVMGTYGYMAPEYGMEGRFSEKSDVYSFGVLILEIIIGKKNTHYFNDEWSLSLIGCAWKMWSEGNGLSFVEESIASNETEEEMVRCIQIGLLCVQEHPKDRPSIEMVLSMLNHDIVELAAPKQPVLSENGSTDQNVYTSYELTISVLDGR
ncbi:hypothetical protein SASPL_143846 [Salvia splendens]|uniref:Receptor-like serine/threonine-protein kinase n=1 Tax=Salvia splendens TaxID=180675 RepID=A0A8X8ZAD5_SALSN|nr:hypothetical protein SASPL_143846 [Salvia splendens]